MRPPSLFCMQLDPLPEIDGRPMWRPVASKIPLHGARLAGASPGEGAWRQRSPHVHLGVDRSICAGASDRQTFKLDSDIFMFRGPRASDLSTYIRCIGLMVVRTQCDPWMSNGPTRRPHECIPAC